MFEFALKAFFYVACPLFLIWMYAPALWAKIETLFGKGIEKGKELAEDVTEGDLFGPNLEPSREDAEQSLKTIERYFNHVEKESQAHDRFEKRVEGVLSGEQSKVPTPELRVESEPVQGPSKGGKNGGRRNA